MITSSSLSGMKVVKSVLNEGGSLNPIAKIPVRISANTKIGSEVRSRTRVRASSRGSSVRGMLLCGRKQGIISTANIVEE